MRKNMIGTKEVKEVVKENGGVRIGCMILRESRDGQYLVTECGTEIAKTKKLDTALDWMVEMGYLHETRLRLTAEQRSILRSKIFECIGWGLMGGLVTGVGMILTLAWWFVG